VAAGAPLLTASYAPGYWGADGMIFSRGAMVTAAIAKAAQAQPVVVGKPSLAAVHEIEERLGVPPAEQAVIGDDLGMDIALGLLGRAVGLLRRPRARPVRARAGLARDARRRMVRRRATQLRRAHAGRRRGRRPGRRARTVADPRPGGPDLRGPARAGRARTRG